ncbi:hypothetical protein HBH52_147360 [Parastagonospora nodorum]|nr:hypothetical protein HBH52_147360 [Parastagonospora nodorum]
MRLCSKSTLSSFCGLSKTRASRRFGIRNIMTGRQDLFEYTLGRWIYNEKLRLEERQLYFSVEGLKKAATRALNQPESNVQSLRKLAEGGFNRIFELSMKDGTSILARLPYPSTLPRRLAVASEVATMDFVRAHGIPTPRVLGYAVDENHVGSEYILMEKLTGRPIGDSWFELSEQQRHQVLHDIVQLESKLFNMRLPPSGSIYYTHDLDSDTARVRIPEAGGQFCVGPYTGLRWWYGKRSELKLDRGPHMNTLRVLHASAEKELAWIDKHGKPRYPFHRQHREAFQYVKQDPKVHAQSLEAYLRVAPYLIPEGGELEVPMLRHPDVQPNNIFVSEDFRVTSIIDWQHAIVLPNFLAAGIPTSFQNYGDPESRYFTPPQPPAHLDSLDEVERTQVIEAYRRRHVHFFYLGFTQQFNKRHWSALEDEMDIIRRRTFDHASEPWEGLNTPLQYDLVQVTENWGKIAHPDHDGHATTCPVSFTSEETQRIDALDNLHRDADGDVEAINDLLGIGPDGWTSNEHIQTAKKKASEIQEQALASADDDPWLREMSERHWPFDDFDEDE